MRKKYEQDINEGFAMLAEAGQKAAARIRELEDLCDEWQNRTYEKDRRIAELEADWVVSQQYEHDLRDRIRELEAKWSETGTRLEYAQKRIAELEQQLSACRDIDKELGVLREAVGRTARENARLREFIKRELSVRALRDALEE